MPQKRGIDVKKLIALLLLCLLGSSACASVRDSAGPAAETRKETVLTAQDVPGPEIIQKPIAFSNVRRRLMREYARIHYGEEMETIVPRAVVVHWTASDSMEGVYRFFYPEEQPKLKNGTLNVASHFLVGKDGTIWQLTPETALDRHAIGLNWCAIGIENVGGADGKEDLTEAQLEANIRLIRFLHQKYPTITWVLGHYQQDEAMHTELWKENIKGYYHGKIDPGPIFMQGLRDGLAGVGVKFF